MRSSTHAIIRKKKKRSSRRGLETSSAASHRKDPEGALLLLRGLGPMICAYGETPRPQRRKKKSLSSDVSPTQLRLLTFSKRSRSAGRKKRRKKKKRRKGAIPHSRGEKDGQGGRDGQGWNYQRRQPLREVLPRRPTYYAVKSWPGQVLFVPLCFSFSHEKKAIIAQEYKLQRVSIVTDLSSAYQYHTGEKYRATGLCDTYTRRVIFRRRLRRHRHCL